MTELTVDELTWLLDELSQLRTNAQEAQAEYRLDGEDYNASICQDQVDRIDSIVNKLV